MLRAEKAERRRPQREGVVGNEAGASKQSSADYVVSRLCSG